MIKFEKIKPGMTLYDVRKNTGWDRHEHKWNVWPVSIVEVNQEERTVIARWNQINKPEKMYEWRVTKYRLKPPE